MQWHVGQRRWVAQPTTMSCRAILYNCRLSWLGSSVALSASTRQPWVNAMCGGTCCHWVQACGPLLVRGAYWRYHPAVGRGGFSPYDSGMDFIGSVVLQQPLFRLIFSSTRCATLPRVSIGMVVDHTGRHRLRCNNGDDYPAGAARTPSSPSRWIQLKSIT